MDSQAPATRPLVCPYCEIHELVPAGSNSARCPSCRNFVAGPLLASLRKITTLPDATGHHACECGHPEMRLLPDGVYRCPSCAAEVLPLDAPSVSWRSHDHSDAYWNGWLDGRYTEARPFTTNRRLSRLDDPSDRLDYYRGHRAGRAARQSRLGEALKAS